MPGKATQRIPVQRRVETIVDSWVLLPHQHLNIQTTKHLTLHNDEHVFQTCVGVSFHCYHDNQGYVCRPQSFKSFWSVSGPPVVEGGTGNIEPARRVNGQLPIDKVLVPFTLQHWDTENSDTV